MATNLRFVSRQTFTNKGRLYLGHVHAVASRIAREYGTSRRSRISVTVMTRIICAVALRRIQTTALTPYSVAFDAALAANGPVVPAIVNKVVAAIPMNSQYLPKGELVQIDALDKDLAEYSAYVVSATFVSDIESLKTFAETSSFNFVDLNAFEPQVEPSVSVRIRGNAADSISVPIEGRIVTDKVRAIDYASGNYAGYVTIKTELVGGSYPIEVQEYVSTPYPIARDKSGSIVNPNELITVIRERKDTCLYGTGSAAISIHIAGTSEDLNTNAKCLAALFPIAIYVSGDTREPDALDIVQGTLLSHQPDDAQAYYGIFINEAITKTFNRLSSFKPITSDTTEGTVDTRAGVKQPRPSQGMRTEGQSPAPNSAPKPGPDTQPTASGLVPQVASNQAQLNRPQMPQSNDGNNYGQQGGGRKGKRGQRNVSTQALNGIPRNKIEQIARILGLPFRN